MGERSTTLWLHILKTRNTPTCRCPVSLGLLKTAEHQLHQKTSLSRNLWAALVGAMFLVDDWCAGPLLAWRYDRKNLALELKTCFFFEVFNSAW